MSGWVVVTIDKKRIPNLGTNNKLSRYNKEKGVVPKRSLFPNKCWLGTHLPVLPGGEEVGVPGGDGQPADGGDVAGEGELELARGQVPHLDHAVGGARHEPLVAGLNSHRPVEVGEKLVMESCRARARR